MSHFRVYEGATKAHQRLFKLFTLGRMCLIQTKLNLDAQLQLQNGGSRDDDALLHPVPGSACQPNHSPSEFHGSHAPGTRPRCSKEYSWIVWQNKLGTPTFTCKQWKPNKTANYNSSYLCWGRHWANNGPLKLFLSGIYFMLVLCVK